jgi:hypothetical protein
MTAAVAVTSKAILRWLLQEIIEPPGGLTGFNRECTDGVGFIAALNDDAIGACGELEIHGRRTDSVLVEQ